MAPFFHLHFRYVDMLFLQGVDPQIHHPNRVICLQQWQFKQSIVWVGWYTYLLMIDIYIYIYIQWPCQEPKLEVPTIYKAYIRPT